jgi:hypothetical protein
MSPFQCPHSDRLHNYRQDEEDGTEGGTFGGGVKPGIYVRKPVQAKSPDKIEEKANSYEYIAYYVKRSH